MNEEYIQAQFKSINDKLDKIDNIVSQTALQEYRLTKLEEAIVKLQDKRENTIWKWLTPAISAIVAAVMSFVISGGLK